MAEGASSVVAGSNTPADGENENRIFTGHSFYVSRTVPSRDRFCKVIEANGGIIAQIDSKAEFVIVDHLRSGNYKTPVYSYKFLEDCEKNQQLEDIEKYIVGAEGKKALQKGTAPTRRYKAGRIPFTDEDDQILLNWISRPKIALSGNKVYQELEERFPHHTYQSWRGRWVDQLSKTMPGGPKPTRKIDFDNFEATLVGANDNEPLFTREDDMILMDMKDEIIHAANERAVYQKIQRQYPHHSDMEWENRFTTTLLPLINKREVEKTPVQEGDADDVSPRSSEVLSEEQPEPYIPEAAVVEAAQKDAPPPSPESAPAAASNASKASKTSNCRRVTDQAVNYSTMGQGLSTPPPAEKAGKARHSLPTGGKVDHVLPPGSSERRVRNWSGSPSQEPDGKLHTPPHHETQLLKPPKSPKGHPTRDLTISPRPKTEDAHSPAPQHVRVQQWRADVSRHRTGQDIEDDEVLNQIRNEISENSPRLPSNAGFQAESPSSAPDMVADNKRKRRADVEPVTPKTANKRLKAVKWSETEVPSTPEPVAGASNAQFPSTPPPRPGNVRQCSPSFSDPDSLEPAPPTSSRLVSSAVKAKESYHEMSTQAIYDNIPDADEESLVNEEIFGLGDIEVQDEDGEEEGEEEDEEGGEEEAEEADFTPQRLKDEDVFATSTKKANESKGGKGGLNFQAPPPVINMPDFDKADEDEELDEEAVKKEEEELTNYLAEKAAQYRVGKKDVIEAIERTSGDKTLVDIVLDWKIKGNGFPAKIPGIWSVEEDKILLENNARLIMQLEKKHGDRVIERMDWLQKWQDA